MLIDVRNELSEMRTNRDGIENRFNRNQKLLYEFMIREDRTNLPNFWTLINSSVDEIIESFDGSSRYIPDAASGKAGKLRLYNQLSAVYNQENFKINRQLQRKLAISDATAYGTGVRFDGYLNLDKAGSFNGWITEHVHLLDFFYDSSAQQWYDPVGRIGAKKCIRRRWYPRGDAFKALFSDSDYNQKVVNEAAKADETLTREADATVEIGGDAGERTVDENQPRHLVQVLEYWDKDHLIIQPANTDKPIYTGENPYGFLPFVVYNLYNTYNKRYPPGLIDILAPLLLQKDMIVNFFMYNSKLSSVPWIAVDEEATGIMAGDELIPGVQPMDLSNGKDIRQAIQPIQIPNTSAASLNALTYLEDEITSAAGIDTRALISTRPELATKIKKKEQTEVKRLRNAIKAMMLQAETEVAMKAGSIITKFVFADTKDILINDHQEKDGELIKREGVAATIAIDPTDWKNLPFDVIIKSKLEDSISEEERRNTLLRALEMSIQASQTAPEFAQKINLPELYTQIFKTFSDLDIEQIIMKDEEEGMDLKNLTRENLIEKKPDEVSDIQGQLFSQINKSKSHIDQAALLKSLANTAGV